MTFEPDVIVVGAGSAGAAAARRLVDGGAKVLLLEAGGPDTNPAIHDPARVHELWFAPEDWAYRTTPQAHAAGRELHWPRGKVLGGSSCLNAMIYVRGAPQDFDHWAYLGNTGWSWDDVLPVYKRIENFDRGESPMHGAGGPLSVISDWEPSPIHEAIVAAAQECGLALNGDYNAGELDGVSYMQFSIKDGVRDSTAAAYLAPVADNPALRVVTGARARRLLTDGTRCTGVEWVTDGGQVESSLASSEVIVSCGTIESPPLLMRSGIGPGSHLQSLGIDVVLDLPGVGGNLHDHLLSPLIFSAEREIGQPVPGIGHAQTHLWWRSRLGLTVPDVQPIHFMVPLYEEWMEGPENAFSLMAGMVRPASRGTIRLSGPELDDPLLLDPQILSCEADLVSLEAAVGLCRRIGAASPLVEWGATEIYPGPGVQSDAEIRDWVRRTAITYHHQAGSCKMGIDADAVVDPTLRVHGIEGLRVADASVMPAVTSGNTNAPSILIGERVSDFVLAPQSAGVGSAVASA